MQTKFIQVGVGPLGRQIVLRALERRDLRIAGAVDIAPELHGKDVGEICGVDAVGVPISASLEEAVHDSEAEVLVLATVSSIAALETQIRAAAPFGLSIVSTCEELSYPWRAHLEEARRIDELCRKHRIACLGTGVNPGYLMDYLPSVLTTLCNRVTKVEVERVQDAAHRRIPFQQKIGAGLTLEEFEVRKQSGTLRHVGLLESVAMLAAALGWELERMEETLNPVVATERESSGYQVIESGRARGVEQVGSGWVAGREVIRLAFRAAVGEPGSHDTVTITGTPSFRSSIDGGVNGDIATAAVTLNAAKVIGALNPGLRTMLDLPVAGSWGWG